MDKLSKREKILLIALCLLILGFIYYNYIIMPQFNKLNTIEINIDNNIKMINTLKDVEKNIDSNRKQLEELVAQIKEFSTSVPDTSKVPEIIMYIKEMTETSGCIGGKLAFNYGQQNKDMHYSNVSPPFQIGKTKSNEQSVFTMSIYYQVTGDYNSLLTLLDKIENCCRKIVVDRLTVKKDGKDGILSADLNLKCYFISYEDSLQPINYPFLEYTSGKENLFN